jgi:RND family efflux transporter MFP subunit
MRTVLKTVLWMFCVFSAPLLGANDQSADKLAVMITEKQVIPREHYVDGVIEAENQSTVSAQTSGTIVKLNFDVNDYVSKDDVIAEFKNTEQRAAVTKAEAGLRAAMAREREVRAEHARLAAVFKEGAISKSDMEKASSALKGAEAAADSARAELARANEQLGYTLIRAPYSGIVTRRHVEVGETASPGKPIMTGLSLEDLRVLTHVPQRLVTAVNKYQRARIIDITETDKRSFNSNLITMFPFANASSHAMPVRVDLPPNIKGLFPGMFVKVAFVTGERELLLVPRTAIVRRSEVTAVYVREADGYISMRQIRAGRAAFDDQIEVLAGLDEDEAVILDPEEALSLYIRQKSQ